MRLRAPALALALAATCLIPPLASKAQRASVAETGVKVEGRLGFDGQRMTWDFVNGIAPEPVLDFDPMRTWPGHMAVVVARGTSLVRLVLADIPRGDVDGSWGGYTVVSRTKSDVLFDHSGQDARMLSMPGGFFRLDVTLALNPDPYSPRVAAPGSKLKGGSAAPIPVGELTVEVLMPDAVVPGFVWELRDTAGTVLDARGSYFPADRSDAEFSSSEEICAAHGEAVGDAIADAYAGSLLFSPNALDAMIESAVGGKGATTFAGGSIGTAVGHGIVGKSVGAAAGAAAVPAQQAANSFMRQGAGWAAGGIYGALAEAYCNHGEPDAQGGITIAPVELELRENPVDLPDGGWLPIPVCVRYAGGFSTAEDDGEGGMIVTFHEPRCISYQMQWVPVI